MYPFICCYCCSVTQSRLNIFYPGDCSTPGFTTSWTLLKLMSIELMMPSNHLFFCLPPSPPAFNLFQHLGLFQWVSQLFASGGQNFGASASDLLMNIDLLQDGLVGSPSSPRDSQESSPAPQLKNINQRKVRGRSKKVRGPEWGLQVEQRSCLSPICIGQARGEKKTYKKRSQRALSLSLSLSLPPCMRKLSLSLPTSLSPCLPPCLPPLPKMGRSSLQVFGSTCPHSLTMDFPAII